MIDLFLKIKNFKLDIHSLGHFNHYYLKVKDQRFEIFDSDSKRILDLFINLDLFIPFKVKLTEEVGGYMKRVSYSFTLKDDFSQILYMTNLLKINYGELSEVSMKLDRFLRIKSILS